MDPYLQAADPLQEATGECSSVVHLAWPSVPQPLEWHVTASICAGTDESVNESMNESMVEYLMRQWYTLYRAVNKQISLCDLCLRPNANKSTSARCTSNLSTVVDMVSPMQVVLFMRIVYSFINYVAKL